MSESFGQLVRQLRAEKHLSLRALARLAHLDHGHLSRIETGRRDPSPEVAGALDDALEAGGQIRLRVVPNKRVAPGWSLGEGEAGEVEPVDRRAFMRVAGAVALTMGAGQPRHVDPALIGYFRQQLTQHYAADMMLGPFALLETIAAQCRLIGGLIDAADGPTRRSMAQVGVPYSTFAAWLHLDAGDPRGALRWHDVAQEWAYRAQDREAVACALVDRAMARTDLGTGAAVVDLCEAALLDESRLHPEVRVFAYQQQAHGASLLNDRAEADRLLDTAGALIGSVDVELWGTACLRTPHYVEVQRATCYGRLGLPREAERIWSQILPDAPPSARRDVGVWSARRAQAAAAAGEPEHAVELARQSVSIAVDTGSARARRELTALGVAMVPWQSDPVGRDLVEVLAPITGRN